MYSKMKPVLLCYVNQFCYSPVNSSGGFERFRNLLSDLLSQLC